MSAGTGVRHSEFNHAADQTTHFLQIWILPRQAGIEPGYEQKHFDAAAKRGRLALVASPDGRDGSVTIHADASIRAGLFDGAERLEQPIDPGRITYVHLVRGSLRVNDHALHAGDAARLDGEPKLVLEGGRRRRGAGLRPRPLIPSSTPPPIQRNSTMSTPAPVALIARILLALMFVMAGVSKLAGLEGTAGYIASAGLPLPTVLAVGAGLLELVAGIALAVGFQARIAALALALFTIVATVLFHNFWAAPADQAFVQQLMFMKNLAVTGGLLFVFALGAGPASIDMRRQAAA